MYVVVVYVADVVWAGKVTAVTSASRIQAVSSATARNRGSVRAKRDGEDSSATKVRVHVRLGGGRRRRLRPVRITNSASCCRLSELSYRRLV